jgi:hypothetical protein
MQLIDETGNKYSHLTVLAIAPKNGKDTSWICKCDCGKETIVRGTLLRKGLTKSCGHIRTWKYASLANVTHGASYSRLYSIWCGMKSRCYTKSHIRYARYGGRGIKVCEKWKDSFAAFQKWAMENGYNEDLTIDRKDNDKNYEPSNCRWITLAENSKKARLAKLGRVL